MQTDIILKTPEEEAADLAIADRIRELHSNIKNLMKQTLLNAYEIGELLQRKKDELPHGRFNKWVEDNCNFNRRTASNYMRINEY